MTCAGICLRFAIWTHYLWSNSKGPPGTSSRRAVQGHTKCGVHQGGVRDTEGCPTSESLSRRQYAVIIITIVIPALILPVLPSSITGGPVRLAVIYIGWIAVVVLSVASMLDEDQSKAKQSVDRKLKTLSTEVQRAKGRTFANDSWSKGPADRDRQRYAGDI